MKSRTYLAPPLQPNIQPPFLFPFLCLLLFRCKRPSDLHRKPHKRNLKPRFLLTVRINSFNHREVFFLNLERTRKHRVQSKENNEMDCGSFNGSMRAGMLRSGEDLIKICISLTLIAKNRGLRNKSNERVTRELYCIEFFFGCGFHNGDNGRFYGRHCV